MRSSWQHLFRRLAARCVLAGGTAWSSAVCYAAQVAFDTPDNSVYNNGWQVGDNGGFGFGPWNFDGTYNSPPPGQQAIDNGLKSGGTGSSPYNNIGRAWTLFNANASNVTTNMPVGTTPGPDNPPSNDTDISRAGRAIPGNLQVGSTVKIVIDNPVERRFFRGWTVHFNTGGGNTCFNCTPTARMRIGTFEYTSYGQWYTSDDGPRPTLFDTDTDAGMRIEFTLTGTNTFDLKMIPLDNPSLTFMKSDALTGSGPIDWIEFQFYNTDSDFYPSIAPGPALQGDYNGNGSVDAADYVLWRQGGPLQNEVDTPGTINAADYTEWRARFGNMSMGDVRATDFYIRSMEITTPETSATEFGVVPEPGAFTYIISGCSGLFSILLCLRSAKSA
jgi:hypothetical protein